MIFQGFVERGEKGLSVSFSRFGETDIWTPVYFIFILFLSLFSLQRTIVRIEYYLGDLYKHCLGSPRLGIRYFVNITVCKMEIKCSCLLLGNLRNIFFSHMYMYIYIYMFWSVVIDETLWMVFYSVNDYEFRLFFFSPRKTKLHEMYENTY